MEEPTANLMQIDKRARDPVKTKSLPLYKFALWVGQGLQAASGANETWPSQDKRPHAHSTGRLRPTLAEPEQ